LWGERKKRTLFPREKEEGTVGRGGSHHFSRKWAGTNYGKEGKVTTKKKKRQISKGEKRNFFPMLSTREPTEKEGGSRKKGKVRQKVQKETNQSSHLKGKKKSRPPCPRKMNPP